MYWDPCRPVTADRQCDQVECLVSAMARLVLAACTCAFNEDLVGINTKGISHSLSRLDAILIACVSSCSVCLASIDEHLQHAYHMICAMPETHACTSQSCDNLLHDELIMNLAAAYESAFIALSHMQLFILRAAIVCVVHTSRCSTTGILHSTAQTRCRLTSQRIMNKLALRISQSV